ncbi:MAG TPA: precorrin-2 C(20)-methyltransferase [Stellaceae bacterium]|nr:precorrin-2 C(20)-methyltransferase [Stellaceae bacterium]
MSGTLYGLGVGPGDPELVTLKVLRTLRDLPVIAYPAPEDGASFARSLVASWLSPAQTEIAIRVPMTRSVAPAQAVYDRAALEIAGHLEAGRDVGVLCQGDPFFYGSFIQIFERLSPRFPTQVVPGVSSLMACAAAAGSPLAMRDEILTILPATLGEPALEKRLKQAETAAIMKLGRNLRKVRRVLKRLRRADHATYVEHASLDSQKVLALDAVDPASAPYFSMVLVRRGSKGGR